ncbi:hypothetical protein SUDANB6_05713 [Streptomyces sp. enrichment culture]
MRQAIHDDTGTDAFAEHDPADDGPLGPRFQEPADGGE